MILECIVTTLDPGGRINVAPMGVVLKGEVMLLRPFRDTTTYRNLVSTGQAVVNSTDDACLFAYAALGEVEPSTLPAAAVRGRILASACHYWEVEVEAVGGGPERAEIRARVVAEGRLREFLGFNRARHALLEATILATRVHLLPATQIREELERLAVVVHKTGGAAEREAMAFVREHVGRRLDDLPAAGRREG